MFMPAKDIHFLNLVIVHSSIYETCTSEACICANCISIGVKYILMLMWKLTLIPITLSYLTENNLTIFMDHRPVWL